MGMAASQARLLSITARLTDNENSGQAISYAKQRLADQTQQITNEYNEALNATKLTVLTGFNGAEANYTDISYSLMTGLQMAEEVKQYVVTDTKGRILVTEEIAKAFEKSHGNVNQFLYNLGYSQADINVQMTSSDDNKKQAAMIKIHEAWDKYFETVGIDFMIDDEHKDPDAFTIAWTTTWATDKDGDYIDANGNKITKDELGTKGVSNVGDGYASYFDKKNNVYQPINYEGTTQASRDLYDYAMALTEAYLRTGGSDNNANYNLNDYNSAYNSDNLSALSYYKNIFSKMMSNDYFTYTNTPSLAAKDEHYIYA